jgi:hypothetical protein
VRRTTAGLLADLALASPAHDAVLSGSPTCGASLPKRTTSATIRRKLGLTRFLRWMKMVLRSWLAHSSLPAGTGGRVGTRRFTPNWVQYFPSADVADQACTACRCDTEVPHTSIVHVAERSVLHHSGVVQDSYLGGQSGQATHSQPFVATAAAHWTGNMSVPAALAGYQQPLCAVAAPTLIHGEGERHVRRLCVHPQVIQEAHQVGVGGQIVHLVTPTACKDHVTWLLAESFLFKPAVAATCCCPVAEIAAKCTSFLHKQP